VVEDVPRGRWLREVWQSTIGKKVIVAISGAILGLYVVLHALGNLKAFQGVGGGIPPIDHYAEWLRTAGEPVLPRNGALWAVRSVLILALVLHVTGIAQLAKRNRAARPAGQRNAAVIQRSLAARTMMLTGLVLLAFIVFHILQFTTRTIQVTPVHAGSVYTNLDAAFAEWYFVAIYVIAVGLLGLHLRHALWSLTQTLGWDKPNRNPTIRRTATVVATAVALGFAAVPLGFWSGALEEPGASPSQQASTGEAVR
jgi:succinate dehydrogenase / fumarate reductase cytochrome b subunit